MGKERVRGRCERWGKDVVVRKDGRLAVHRAEGEQCEGSGELPAYPEFWAILGERVRWLLQGGR